MFEYNIYIGDQEKGSYDSIIIDHGKIINPDELKENCKKFGIEFILGIKSSTNTEFNRKLDDEMLYREKLLTKEVRKTLQQTFPELENDTLEELVHEFDMFYFKDYAKQKIDKIKVYHPFTCKLAKYRKLCKKCCGNIFATTL